MAFEVPLKAQGIEAQAERGVRGLKDQENRHSVERVLEAPTEKTGKMGISENPAIAQPGIERSGVLRPSGHGVSAARPDLNLVATFFGGLGVCDGWGDQEENSEQEFLPEALASLRGTDQRVRHHVSITGTENHARSRECAKCIRSSATRAVL